MKLTVVIFYFRTGSDALSQKIKRNLCIFSDSFVLYSCCYHVPLAEIRTSANLTGFHSFAFMHVFTQIFYFRTGGDGFSQRIKYFFLMALLYSPVAAMCSLPKHLGEFDSV